MINSDNSEKDVEFIKPTDYQAFLLSYLKILEQMTFSCQEAKEISKKGILPIEGRLYDRSLQEQQYFKQLAYLRVAEHIFNFFIDQFPGELILEHFGSPENFYQLKNQRDLIADTLAQIIESDPDAKARYIEFCEKLKDPRMLGCGL